MINNQTIVNYKDKMKGSIQNKLNLKTFSKMQN